MKNKSLFLVLVILCLTSVEIYSSRQELKFDAPLPSNTENGNARSDYGPPGEGDMHRMAEANKAFAHYKF